MPNTTSPITGVGSQSSVQFHVRSNLSGGFETLPLRVHIGFETPFSVSDCAPECVCDVLLHSGSTSVEGVGG